MLKYLIISVVEEQKRFVWPEEIYYVTFYFVIIRTLGFWAPFTVAIARSWPEIGHIDFCTNLATSLHRSLCVCEKKYYQNQNSISDNSILLTCSMCVIKSSGSKDISSSAAA